MTRYLTLALVVLLYLVLRGLGVREVRYDYE